MYLDQAALAKLRAALHGAALVEPLVFLTTARAPEDDGFAVEVERYPGGQSKRIAVVDFHGEWLDWGR
jgi:hypothetical protein